MMILCECFWLGCQDSNLGMAESKSTALPLGYTPVNLIFARYGNIAQSMNDLQMCDRFARHHANHHTFHKTFSRV
jgi:hypothetical protein